MVFLRILITNLNMKRILILSILGLAALALASCNTLVGVGKDLRRAGGALMQSAN